MSEQLVSFDSGGVTLAGTLTVPNDVRPAPALLMLPGSGETDRDDNAKKLAINVFPQLAQVAGDIGFVTFRFDKRGVGASGGDYWATGFNDRLTDATAAVEWLAKQPSVDASRIFVLGHSEGALIAIRLAAAAAPVAGVVLLAGSAKTGEQILLWQGREIAKTLTGFSKWLVGTLHVDTQAQQAKYIAKLKATTGDVARIQLVQKINARWMREFLVYDPAVDVVRVKVPVLAITGSRDIQVDPADLERMAELLPGDFESHLVPDVTHLLRASGGEPGLKGYKRQVGMPVDERVVGYIRNWLVSKAGAGDPGHHRE